MKWRGGHNGSTAGGSGCGEHLVAEPLACGTRDRKGLVCVCVCVFFNTLLLCLQKSVPASDKFCLVGSTLESLGHKLL